MYPSSISRCQHIKVNGTQCGSPSLKSRRLCFFHNRWRETRIDFNNAGSAHFTEIFALPVLEDANAIQVTIMQVLRLIIAKHLDSKTAGLLLYGLQTASGNLKSTRFEPRNQKDVVIDPRTVADSLLGEHIWDPSQYEAEQHQDDQDEAEVEQPEPVATNPADSGGSLSDAEVIGQTAGPVEIAGPVPMAEKKEAHHPAVRNSRRRVIIRTISGHTVGHSGQAGANAEKSMTAIRHRSFGITPGAVAPASPSPAAASCNV